MSARLEAPRWAQVLGTLGICFGAVGMLGGAQDLAWPYVVEIQKQAVQRVGESLQAPDAPAVGGGSKPGRWLERPDWYAAYADAMAVVRGLLGGLLILASAWLIQVRAGADRLFLYATGLSAARNLVAVAVGVAAGSVLAVFTVAAGTIGFLLDTALLLACRFARRDVYRSGAPVAGGGSSSS